jgi:WD40 repeat protein
MSLLVNKKPFHIPESLKEKCWIELVKECTEIDSSKRPKMKKIRLILLYILYDKIRTLKGDDLMKDLSINNVSPQMHYIILTKINKYLEEWCLLSSSLNQNLFSYEFYQCLDSSNNQPVTCLYIMKNGSLLSSSLESDNFKMWNLTENCECIQNISISNDNYFGNVGQVNSFLERKDGLIIAGTSHGLIKIYFQDKTNQLVLLKSLDDDQNLHKNSINSICEILQYDGFFATGCADGKVKIWKDDFLMD